MMFRLAGQARGRAWPYHSFLAGPSQIRAASSTRNRLFKIAEEVEEALHSGRPVVALETTIYTHGFPYPENVALASLLESLVRQNGGVPATIGILNGKAHVGMQPEELIELISTAGSMDTRKISRRDLGYIGGLAGLRGQKLHGGTTISGTMILAHLAGIKVFATGGLGGVHKGGENSMDISADLTELGRTPVAVVSSGCKSFLDIPRTLEYLETQGVGVATFADGRDGEVDFPAFFSRDSGVKSPFTVQNEADAAAIIHAQSELPVRSGLLFANPVPSQSGMARSEIDGIVAQAVKEAEDMGVTGAKNTPYVLKRIRELSNNASVGANEALIKANVVRGTKVAVELAKLEQQNEGAITTGSTQIASHMQSKTRSARTVILSGNESSETRNTAGKGVNNTSIASSLYDSRVEVLVIGSIAADTSCDFAPLTDLKDDPSIIAPVLHTSNPAVITGSAGGVGRNVATAASYAGAKVALLSVVADDLAGNSLKADLIESGIDVGRLVVLGQASDARTAQYISVNDRNKDLVHAMADFSIFDQPRFDRADYWSDVVSKEPRPKWLVTDGNWSINALYGILAAAHAAHIPIAFEPVSTVKATRLLHVAKRMAPAKIVDVAAPNVYELAAMEQAARDCGLFEHEQWWDTINAFELSSGGSRDKFVRVLGSRLTDQGIPQQTIRLLPYIPNIVTKLGAQGSLLTAFLRKDDPRLSDVSHAPYVLSRSTQSSDVGGIYMRLFPSSEIVSQHDVVSVNGVGDTMLGVMIAGLVQQGTYADRVRLDTVIPVAQKAAVFSLKSKLSVSPDIRTNIAVAHSG